MVPSRLYAQPGQKILPKLTELLDWIRRQRIIPQGDNVFVSETANGTLVSYEDRPIAIPHPMKVLLASEEGFYLTENSYVNNISPVFYDEKVGQYRRADLYLRAENPALIPTHRPDEEVYFFIVVRFLGLGEAPLTSGSFTIVHACVEAWNAAMMDAAGLTLDDMAMGTPTKNTAKGTLSPAPTAQFHIPIAFMQYGVVYQFVQHNLNYRVYYDTERKRMVYWAA